MKESCFVVKYNHTTHKFAIDFDTTDARFSDGVMWDDSDEEWKRPLGEEDEGNDNDGSTLLTNLLNFHNNGVELENTKEK